MKMFSRFLLVAFTLGFAASISASDWQLSIASGLGSANDPTNNVGTDVDLDAESMLYFVANRFERSNSDGADLYSEFLIAIHDLTIDVTNGTDSYSTSVDATHLQIGGIYEWANETRFHPYFAMTIGVSLYSPELNDEETYLSGSVALGARFWITDALAFRLEARNLGTLLDSSTSIFCNNEDGCSLDIDGTLWSQQHYTAGVSWNF